MGRINAFIQFLGEQKTVTIVSEPPWVFAVMWVSIIVISHAVLMVFVNRASRLERIENERFKLNQGEL